MLVVMAFVFYVLWQREDRKYLGDPIKNPSVTGRTHRASSTPSPSGGYSTVEINARVRFSDGQFTITNNDSFDWTNAKLEVNDRWSYRADRLSAGETYTIGVAQFTLPDGERFNPWTHAVKDFEIFCKTPRGDGFWLGNVQ